MTLDDLQQALDYQFADPALLAQALTHRSAEGANNERLEFLGDSVLNFVIAAEVFRLRDGAQEGELSRLRATLVNKSSLAKLARELGLGGHIRLGSGELKSGGRRRDSILADALEAIFGAVYLDAGFARCRELILALYAGRLADLPSVGELKDPKTRLQEYLQSLRLPLPEYRVLDVTGRAHDQTFRVVCAIDELNAASEGAAGSRRQAEQQAAEALLETLEQERGRG
ncbi:ribonuclease III [Sediminicurvatus halobius]|uniref:ribonuclease III n=1 Tax=Sediminicurvatus halobius TaxID=2182432 RepID=UPI001E55E09C|nr:ribonuclease III [Spiribacter halobius]UEX76245.1 ribonuclease III [Spiribacter halobius]